MRPLLLLRPDWESEAERAAATKLAVHPDTTAMEFDDSLREHETEARAFMTAC